MKQCKIQNKNCFQSQTVTGDFDRKSSLTFNLTVGELLPLETHIRKRRISKNAEMVRKNWSLHKDCFKTSNEHSFWLVTCVEVSEGNCKGEVTKLNRKRGNYECENFKLSRQNYEVAFNSDINITKFST